MYVLVLLCGATSAATTTAARLPSRLTPCLAGVFDRSLTLIGRHCFDSGTD